MKNTAPTTLINAAVSARTDHHVALRHFAAKKSNSPRSITTSEIDAYVSNLWDRDKDPYLYTTD